MPFKLTTALTLGLVLSAATAQAQETHFEETHHEVHYISSGSNDEYAARSLILDSGTVRLDLAPADRGLRIFGNGLEGQPGLIINKVSGESSHAVNANVGVAFGVADVLEVGAIVAPFGLAPDGRPDTDTFGNPAIYARAGVGHGPVQIAGQVGVSIPTNDTDLAVLQLAVPVKFQLTAHGHISTGVSFLLTDLENFADDGVVVFRAPLEIAGNLTRNIFIGANTALVFNVAPEEGDEGSVPVGAFAGYTVHLGNNSALDLQASFTFTDLVGFGKSRGDTVNEESYQVVLGANLYGDLLN